MVEEGDPEYLIPVSDNKLGVETIPMILISKASGMAIDSKLDSQKVLLNVDFDIPYKTEGTPNAMLWMGPLNRLSYEFLIEFERYYFHLKDVINFEPVHVLDQLVTK